MAFSSDELAKRYHIITSLSVASGTQVSTRVSDIIKHLNHGPKDDGKPVILGLSTSSRNANKLITIVEIAKRELASNGAQLYQYNALGSETIKVERKAKQFKEKSKDASLGVDDQSDDAFETMGENDGGGEKIRLVPTMTTYLSSASIKELKMQYGYVAMSCRSGYLADPYAGSRSDVFTYWLAGISTFGVSLLQCTSYPTPTTAVDHRTGLRADVFSMKEAHFPTKMQVPHRECVLSGLVVLE